MSQHRRILWLTAAAGLTLALALALRSPRAPFVAPPPRGAPDPQIQSWNVDAVEADRPRDEALARQLSLPYSAGVVRATRGRFGVRAWDPQRAQPGWNLYVSGHATDAVLLSMAGEVLHRWRLDVERAFPGIARTEDGGFLRRAALLPDGSLLALVAGMGLAKLDMRSNLLWSTPAPFFNDLWVAPDAQRILVLGKRGVVRPDLRAGTPVLEDAVVTLDGSGRELARASLVDAFQRSPYAALLRPLGDTADILHSNTIEVLGGPGTRESGPFAAGNLLVSLREIDTVAVLDPAGERVLWAQRGPFRGQHEPSLLPDGHLLLFDNLGRGGRFARVVTLDPASGALTDEWLGPGDRPLESIQAGATRRLGNGNLLVVESGRGAAWELDGERRIVWEFRSPHRAGPRRELVATLLDLVRYEATTPFLARVLSRDSALRALGADEESLSAQAP